MSNIKQIHIEADVPFNFLQEMPDEDAAFFARLFGPSMGIDIHYRSSGYLANGRGGKTAIYHCEVVGQEAISFGALERLRDLLGNVALYDVIDIEDMG